MPYINDLHKWDNRIKSLHHILDPLNIKIRRINELNSLSEDERVKYNNCTSLLKF